MVAIVVISTLADHSNIFKQCIFVLHFDVFWRRRMCFVRTSRRINVCHSGNCLAWSESSAVELRPWPISVFLQGPGCEHESGRCGGHQRNLWHLWYRQDRNFGTGRDSDASFQHENMSLRVHPDRRYSQILRSSKMLPWEFSHRRSKNLLRHSQHSLTVTVCRVRMSDVHLWMAGEAASASTLWEEWHGQSRHRSTWSTTRKSS